MADDLVERIRDAIAGRSIYSGTGLLDEAAAEIERLREKCVRLTFRKYGHRRRKLEQDLKRDLRT